MTGSLCHRRRRYLLVSARRKDPAEASEGSETLRALGRLFVSFHRLRRYVPAMKTMIISLGMLCALALVAHGQDAKATCKLESKSGSQAAGVVTFTKAGDDVQVVGDITGLKPGKHGIHIHEKGDCSAADAASAGAHFNPGQHKHGGPMTTERHEGDLGNIEADASGKAHIDWKGKMSLSGAESIIGKSLVVHEKEDDLKTDPSGNSGARIACGVIEAAK
jgi:Cu-Zn family superoxide dismutase